MPVIKSAIKKLRKDKKREKAHEVFRKLVLSNIKLAKKTKSSDQISKAYSLIDKSVKKHLMHNNKAARIKSSLSRLLVA